ncbi:HIT family protein [Stappia indica]|uniref:HIT family protein n=1 Tax=Stappia indica TaxID=538381 RepID=UPI001CD1E635|nr:HIT family protein [Stappia indica]MCA1299916.1 HIT family protein [Stappia indica]
MTPFVLDPRLAADTLPVGLLGLCAVRLMSDARFPWLMLVPQRPDLTEILDLDEEERHLLMREIAAASSALRAVTVCDKLNVGALGNLVPQLHVHVIARFQGDAAWPGPVWGQGVPLPYEEDVAGMLIRRLRDALGMAPSGPGA